jgi:hypothetical protein
MALFKDELTTLTSVLTFPTLFPYREDQAVFAPVFGEV